jgi:hypothetical protein
MILRALSLNTFVLYGLISNATLAGQIPQTRAPRLRLLRQNP